VGIGCSSGNAPLLLRLAMACVTVAAVFVEAFRRRRAWIAGESARQLCAWSGARWAVAVCSLVALSLITGSLAG
jgi:hypothetical protein